MFNMSKNAKNGCVGNDFVKYIIHNGINRGEFCVEMLKLKIFSYGSCKTGFL